MANIYLKTAFGYIRRAPFQALAAISVMAVTFFVASIIAVVVYSSSRVLNYFETRPQIIAFLKDEATPQTISALQNKLASDSRVKDIKYVSKEEALEIYKKATSSNPLLAELVSPSIFPASIEFSATDLKFAKDIIAEVKKEGVVESVGFTASLGGESTLGDVVERLKSITFYIRVAGVGFVTFLTLTSFLVLMVVIGMRIATRKEEIEILDLIGATPGFIRLPIILEATSYAVIGVLTGWLLATLLVLYSTPAIISYFGDISPLPRNTYKFFGLLGSLLGVELLLGIVIALGGTIVAIARAHRKR